jgi:transcriptional regulator
MELLRGTLDMMVLKALSQGPRHGYAVAHWIEEGSGETLTIEEGSLYPALHRMERRGWIESEWGQSENNRRAKYYSLTKPGRTHLKAEAASWERFAKAVTLLMGPATPREA